MLLNKGEYKDLTANITYKVKDNLSLSESIILIKGENGVGKTRFLEGVLLKELKKNKIKMLYFGQDIENQILSFELISLVKTFIQSLKKEGSFFKTIFLNDDSHNQLKLDFNEKSTLTPDKTDIKNFIFKECNKFTNSDVLIFDEADKFFDSEEEFISMLKDFKNKTIVIISHIINSEKLSNAKELSFTLREGAIEVEF